MSDIKLTKEREAAWMRLWMHDPSRAATMVDACEARRRAGRIALAAMAIYAVAIALVATLDHALASKGPAAHVSSAATMWTSARLVEPPRAWADSAFITAAPADGFWAEILRSYLESRPDGRLAERAKTELHKLTAAQPNRAPPAPAAEPAGPGWNCIWGRERNPC